MRISGSLSALLATAALTMASPLYTLAGPGPEPAAVAAEAAAAPTSPAAPAIDADRYAAREAQDRSAAEFQGGDSVVILGSTAAVILVVVLLVVLL